MQSDDIVERLRDCTCVPHGEICREAAAENDRLRAARDEWIAGTVHHASRANGETEAR